MTLDPTIGRLALRTMRRHRDLNRLPDRLGGAPWDLLAYEAIGEDAYGRVRLAAIFPASPFGGGEPLVYALDGERRSLHRNPPFDEGRAGHSGCLCLYFDEDPPERRWSAEYGLLELFDLARRHLLAEHVWRQTGRWPTRDAPHGYAARPVPRRPDLKVPPLRNQVATE